MPERAPPPAALLQAVRDGDWPAARARLAPAEPAPAEGGFPGDAHELVATALWRLRPRPGGGLGTDDKLARGALRKLLAAPAGLAPALVELDWPWPHRAPERLGDDEVARWLDVLTQAPRLDAGSLPLLQTAFRARPRTQWPQAARVLGRLAGRGPGLAREALTGLAASITDGGRVAWSARPEGPTAWGAWPHDRRHAVVALAAWIVADRASAEAAGATPALLLRDVPKTEPDRSALALAVAELAGVEALRGEVGAWVEKVLRLERPEPQLADAFVALAEASPAPDATRWLLALARRPARLDSWPAAIEWVGARLTLAVPLAARLEPDALRSWLEEEPELAVATALALLSARDGLPAPAREVADALAAQSCPWLGRDSALAPTARRDAWLEAVRPRLARLGDPAAWELLPALGRAVLVEELVRLLQDPEAQDVRWSRLVESAGWPAQGDSDPARRARPEEAAARRGPAEVVLALDRIQAGAPAEKRVFPGHLVHAIVLELPEALGLVGHNHGFLDTQIALALERALRRGDEGLGRIPDDPGRLRLLFQVLHRRPSERLLRELELFARDDGLARAARAAGQVVVGVRALAGAGPTLPKVLEVVRTGLAALAEALPGATAELAALGRLCTAIGAAADDRLRERVERLGALVTGVAGGLAQERRSASGRVPRLDPARDPTPGAAPATRETRASGRHAVEPSPGPSTFTALLAWLESEATVVDALVAAVRELQRAVESVATCQDVAGLVAWHARLEAAVAGLSRRAEASLPEVHGWLVRTLLAPTADELAALGDATRELHRGARASSQQALAVVHAAREHVMELLAREGFERVERDAVARVLSEVVERVADGCVDEALRSGDEPRVLSLLGPRDVPLLTHASEARLLALRGWLLDRLLVGAVRYVNRHPAVSARGLGGAILTHFSPLLYGIPVGTFQLYQLAGLCTEMVTKGNAAVILGLCATGCAWTAFYLAWQLYDRPVRWSVAGFLSAPGPTSSAPVTGRALGRAVVALRRTAPLFLVALLESMVCAAAALWFVSDTQVVQDLRTPLQRGLALGLWTTLSLFVGIFVGVIAQGRKLGAAGTAE